MMSRRKTFWTILKIAIILFLMMVVYSIFTLLLQTVLEPIRNDDEEYRFRHFQELIAEDNYGDLYDELTLFGCYDEKYDDFWEAAKAWQLYCRYEAASLAVQKIENAEHTGTCDTDFLAACQTQAENAREALQGYPSEVDNPTARAGILRIKEKMN